MNTENCREHPIAVPPEEAGERFLRALWHHAPPGSFGWAFAEKGDPANWKGWGGVPVPLPVNGKLPSYVAKAITTDSNLFAAVGAYRVGEDGKPHRRKGCTVGTLAVFLDDVGTGIGSKPSSFTPENLPLVPSALVETSPSNFQAWFFYDGLVDPEVHDRLTNALVSKGYVNDPGMVNVTRYGRPPGGVNGKAKYGEPSPAVRLAGGDLGLRYSIEQIVRAFGLDEDHIVHGIGATPMTGDDAAPASVAEARETLLAFGFGRWLHENGKITGYKGSGWWTVDCPWPEDHSDDRDEADFHPRTATRPAGFKCHHGSHAGKTTADFYDYMKAQGWEPESDEPFEVFTEEEESRPPPSRGYVPEADPGLLLGGPGVFGDITAWFMRAARNPEPTYAFGCAVAAMTALLAKRVRTDTGIYANMNLLVPGPTETGKNDIKKKAALVVLAADADDFMFAFDPLPASAEGLWWHLSETGEMCIFEPEYGEELRKMTVRGEARHEILAKTVRMLFDCADEVVKPLAYSKRASNAKPMPPLSFPYLTITGTTTINQFSALGAAGAHDGLINRHTILPCGGVGKETFGTHEGPPVSLAPWWKKFCEATATKERCFTVEYAPGARDAIFGLKAKHKKERDAHPGTWGRIDYRTAQLALIASCAAWTAGPVVITLATARWAASVVTAAATAATEMLIAEGGFAENDGDAMVKAVLGAFASPTGQKRLTEKGYLNRKDLGQFAGRAWSKCADKKRRESVLATMIDDGKIEVVTRPDTKGEARPVGWKKG